MSMSGLTRTLVALAAATALALSAAPSQARSEADGPDYGAPRIGACSTLTLKQAYAPVDKSTVVPCSKAHTAKVAGVVTLPDSLSYSSDVSKLDRVIEKECIPQVNAMLGRNFAVRDSSAYSSMWFTPSKNQQDHGARWLSCSIVLLQGYKLAKLPTNKVPMLPSGKLGDAVHRCLLADIAHNYVTTCASKHGWRATGSFVVASKKFPGARTLNRLARTKCVSRVQKGKPYRWTYWTGHGWVLTGDHVVTCYSKTTR